MVRASRHPALRMLGVLAALAWAWSIHAGQLHQLRAAHAFCLEHAHVVDVPATGASVTDEATRDGPHQSGQSAWAATADGDHGCVVQVLVPHELPPIVVVRTARPISYSSSDPIAAREAPRGPPLDYAPKTSPPALA